MPLLANTRRHRPRPLAQGHKVSNRIGQNSRSQGPGQILEAGFSHSVAPLGKHAGWEPWLSVALQVAQEKAEFVPGMLPTSIWWSTGTWISSIQLSCSGAPSMTLPLSEHPGDSHSHPSGMGAHCHPLCFQVGKGEAGRP